MGDKRATKNWGPIVKKFRKDKLLQSDVAKIMGVSRAYLSMAENGEQRLSDEHIKRLVRFLEITEEDLKNDDALNAIETKKVRSVDIRKFRDMLLYLLNLVGAKPNVGETVLYKLLYFIEKEYYLAHNGRLLVGLEFIKRPFGPVPAGFRDLVTDSIEAGDISMIRTEFHGFPQKKYLPNRSLEDLRTASSLSAEEMHVIDNVVDEYSDFNANTITQLSHKESTWLKTPDNKKIDFKLLHEQA